MADFALARTTAGALGVMRLIDFACDANHVHVYGFSRAYVDAFHEGINANLPPGFTVPLRVASDLYQRCDGDYDQVVATIGLLLDTVRK